MNPMTVPPGLEHGMAELQTLLARILGDLERLKTRHVLARAVLSHHTHDFTRDVTGQPTTYAPSTHNHDSSYASDTHVHNYEDGQYTLEPVKNVDVSRTTGGPV
jgi:hypothetical protein